MRNKKNSIKDGVCKLTKKNGKFVKSHIIPIALNKLNKTGERVFEKSADGTLKKKFHGWYDNQLCIAESEGILSRIDTKGIEVLRENKLIWASWSDDEDKLNTDDIEMDPQEFGVGIRVIKDIDWKTINIFILSILWRSAASQRPEMSTVNLDDELLEKLRCAILSEKNYLLTSSLFSCIRLLARGMFIIERHSSRI